MLRQRQPESYSGPTNLLATSPSHEIMRCPGWDGQLPTSLATPGLPWHSGGGTGLPALLFAMSGFSRLLHRTVIP